MMFETYRAFKNDTTRSYFYFTGETVEGEILEFETETPVTRAEAELKAKEVLREVGGGHIDVWYSETDEYAFDVEADSDE